jgi:hypothetical protein
MTCAPLAPTCVHCIFPTDCVRLRPCLCCFTGLIYYSPHTLFFLLYSSRARSSEVDRRT